MKSRWRFCFSITCLWKPLPLKSSSFSLLIPNLQTKVVVRVTLSVEYEQLFVYEVVHMSRRERERLFMTCEDYQWKGKLNNMNNTGHERRDLWPWEWPFKWWENNFCCPLIVLVIEKKTRKGRGSSNHRFWFSWTWTVTDGNSSSRWPSIIRWSLWIHCHQQAIFLSGNSLLNSSSLEGEENSLTN